MVEENKRKLCGIGEGGPYQRRMVILLCLSEFFSIILLMGSVYIVYSPDHRCFIDKIDSQIENNSTLLNITAQTNDLELHIPRQLTNDKSYWNQCYRYNNSITETGSKSSKNQSLVHCDQGWWYTKPDYVETATTEFNLVCDDAFHNPLATTLQMVGFLIGCLFGGPFADRYGRRKTLLLSFELLVVSIALMVLTPNVIGLHVGMLIFGICTTIRVMTNAVLLNEVVSQKVRKHLAILQIGSGTLGIMSLNLFAYLLPNWRWMLAAIGIVELIFLIVIFLFLDESLKWLLQRKMYSQAEHLLLKMATINKIDIIISTRLLEEEAKVEENAEEVTEERRLSYVDLIKITFLRERLCILGFTWFAVLMTFFGLSLGTNALGGDRYMNQFMNACSEFPGQIICFLLIRKLGCRRLYILLTSSTGIVLVITPFVMQEVEILGTVGQMVGKMFISGSLTTLLLVTGDVFPTLLRAQGVGACSFIGRSAAISVPYILFLGEIVHFSLPYFVMGSLTLLASIVMFFLPETKGHRLPATLEDAQKQDKYKQTIRCWKK